MNFRWLLRFAAWLDARFPPKVVVTQEIFNDMQEKIHRHNKELARLAGENLAERSRIDALEKTISALKDGISKGKIPISATEKDKMREDFIKGEGEAWGRPQSGHVVPASN